MLVNFISWCLQPRRGTQFQINEETNIRLFISEQENLYKVIHVKIFVIIPIMKIHRNQPFVGVF